MNTKLVFEIMKNGYCLWVGAGLSCHLAATSNFIPPNWTQLVQNLEKEAELEVPIYSSINLSQRLSKVLHVLGRAKYARLLRKFIFNCLAQGIVEIADKHIESLDKKIVPTSFLQIATLGTMANPIVNFNVETFTSAAVAASFENYSLKIYNPPIYGLSYEQGSSDLPKIPMFSRHIYHPHGAIDAGKCVLTYEEYLSLNNTLAFQLSVHATFNSNLVIVGMSLEDAYLREQITLFRQQIRFIFWFITQTPSIEIQKWAWINNIFIIEFDNWSSFWDIVEIELPHPNKKLLLDAWFSQISYALGSLEFNAYNLMGIEIDKSRGKSDTDLAEFYIRARDRGEEKIPTLSQDVINEKSDKYRDYYLDKIGIIS